MRIFRKLWSILSSLLALVMVALAFLLAGVRLFGLTPYTVLSGSMEPTYPVGSLIYVSQIDAQDIKVGTPLTFTVADSMIATHRVHELVTIDGETQYITKGDANDALDPPVEYGRVVGSPVFSIPYLGYFSTWLQTRAGTFAGIAVAALLVLTTLLTELLPTAEKSTQPHPEGEQSPPDPQPPAADPDSKAQPPQNTKKNFQLLLKGEIPK